MINLKEIRKAAGMTQAQLADKIGVQRSTITNIELGTIKPSVKTAMAIGEALNFKWSKFFE